MLYIRLTTYLAVAAKEPVLGGDHLDALVAPAIGGRAVREHLVELDVVGGRGVLEDEAADARLDEAEVLRVLGTALGESRPQLRLVSNLACCFRELP